MPALHPDLVDLVAHLRANPAPDASTVPIEVRRANHALASSLTETPPATMASVSSTAVKGAAGPLDARRYVPVLDDETLLLVYFHGGGFVVGTLDTYDGLARHLADACRAPVLSVAYRLAPEHPFPAATDDALAATRDILDRLDELGFAGRSLVVVGDSAGATLAAVTAHEMAARGLPLGGQVLLYPTMGPALDSESATVFRTGYVLEVAELTHVYTEYLGGDGDPTDPRVSPLLSPDIGPTAPAVVVVAELDPLRDEGVAYAHLLEQRGGQVTLLEVEGMVHSFFKMGGVVSAAMAEFDRLGTAVRTQCTRPRP